MTGHRMRQWPGWIVAIVLSLAFQGWLLGQTSTFATITGIVTDPAGAVIPGTTVEITDLETGYVYRTQTNEAGQYTVANLRGGRYRVTVKAQGFQEFVAADVIVNVRDTRRLDASLQVGAVEQVVEVTAGASLIETETAAIADTKDRVVLRALPLTLRRAWDYFTMTPALERTNAWHISIGGTRNNQSVAAFDGIPINDAFGGTGIGPLMDKTESLQELRIDQALGTADQATPGQINLISRAGTNEFHGAISDYYSTPAFRARDPFQRRRSSTRQHIVTASAGGPIYFPKIYNGKNRSFFFFTYEATIRSAVTTSFSGTYPLQPWRQGDFSLGAAPIRDPSTGAPFPGNLIPASRLNSVAKTLQDEFLPLPNFGPQDRLVAGNYRETRLGNNPTQPTITLRLDHQMTSKDFIFGRWTAVRWDLKGYDTNLPTVQEMRPQRRDMDAVTIAESHTFSPAAMNEVRFGFTRQDFPVEPIVRGRQLAQRLGLQGLAPDLPDVGGLPQITFSGIGLSSLAASQTACSPCSRHRIYNFTDNFNWYAGDHSFRFGAFISRSQWVDRRQDAALFGSTEYSGFYTGHPYADFLLGVPKTMRRAFPSIGQDIRRWTTAFYVSDQWKLTRALTLNLGLRWDIHHPYMEANRQMAVFDPASASVVVPGGGLSRVSPLLPRDYVPIIEASRAGRPDTLIKTDWNNVAPRFGVAWRPWGEETVIRGGIGFYYDTAPDAPPAGGAPFVISEPAFTNFDRGPLVLPVVFPAVGTGGPVAFDLPRGARVDLRIPMTMQYSLTLERQQWDTGFRVSYLSTGSRYGLYRWNLNQPMVDGQLYVDKPRPFPKYPAIPYADNGAGHQYHGLTFEVERRMTRGLHFQSYFTWARDIGDLDRNGSPEDSFDRLRERGNMDRVPSWRWSGNWIWQIPYGRGRAFGRNARPVVDAILGGWELSGIFAWEHGRYISPLIRMPDPTGTIHTGGRNRPLVTIRPDRLRDGNLENPSADRWFDVQAFAAPPIGRFGNSGKGVLIGAPTEALHAGLAKNFEIRERVRLRFEIFATNVLNHPNYQDPNTRIDQAVTAGTITAVMNRNLKFDSAIPRELQAQIRLEW